MICGKTCDKAMYMLPVKIKFRFFFTLQYMLVDSQSLFVSYTREIESQPRLKNSNLNIILL